MQLPFTDDTEWRWRWMQTLHGDGVLHRVRTFEAQTEDYGAGVKNGTTVCGISTRWLGMPGVFSRMSAERCQKCCKKLSIEQGKGAPFNAHVLEPKDIED